MAAAGWLAYYTPDETPEYFDTIVQSWDTANKESELADYSVCTTWGVKGKKSYLLHVLRKRMAYPDLKRAVIAQAEAWKARIELGPRGFGVGERLGGRERECSLEFVQFALHALAVGLRQRVGGERAPVRRDLAGRVRDERREVGAPGG